MRLPFLHSYRDPKVVELQSQILVEANRPRTYGWTLANETGHILPGNMGQTRWGEVGTGGLDNGRSPRVAKFLLPVPHAALREVRSLACRNVRNDSGDFVGLAAVFIGTSMG